LLYPAIYYLY